MSLLVVNGDNLELLKKYPDNYFDSVVTDPPYGLGKEPDASELMKDWIEHGYHEINGSGIMGKEWDAFVPQPLFWKEIFRVLKHGGHIVAFFGTRTYDWGVMAMRFSGFQVRDCIQWIYGSGFPKSHNIGKNIEKINVGGIKNLKQIGTKKGVTSESGVKGFSLTKEFVSGKYIGGKQVNGDVAIYEINNEYGGWGTALKPANEPIVLARKPIEVGLSVAENVLKWGTGGINIDGCRVKTNDDLTKNYNSIKKSDIEMGERGYKMDFRQGKESVAEATESTNLGRWPANIILTHHPECECKGVKKVKSDGHHSGKVPDDGGIYKLGLKQLEDKGNIYAENGMEEVEDWECHPDCPIKILDKQSGDRKSNGLYKKEGVWANKGKGKIRTWHVGYDKLNKYDGESGGSSRFFYVAKASKSERNNGLRDFEVKQTKGGGGTYNKETAGKYGSVKSAGHNFHPTVKPIKLMQYLVRLITPPNGKVLDPFCGSGTTGIACKLEGFEFLGMELDPEYAKIADARIKNYKEDKEELLQETKQEDGKDKVNKYIQANLFK